MFCIGRNSTLEILKTWIFHLYKDHQFWVNLHHIGIWRNAPYTFYHALINWIYLHREWSIISILYAECIRLFLPGFCQINTVYRRKCKERPNYAAFLWNWVLGLKNWQNEQLISLNSDHTVPFDISVGSADKILVHSEYYQHI